LLRFVKKRSIGELREYLKVLQQLKNKKEIKRVRV